MHKKITRRDFIRKSSKVIAVTSLSGSGVLLKGCSSKQDYDLVIKDGLIYDGLGKEPIKADIGITGDRIRETGKISISKGKSVIEAKDLSVCPGFIDTHDHTDVGLIVNPKAESAIRQGITTLVSGNCGSSPFPVAEEIFEESKETLKNIYKIDLTWMDIKGFFSKLEEKGMALNYSTLVGQGTIRGAAMGFNDRPPKPDELERMREMVAESLKNGAIGLSSGLEYAPSSFAQPDEIIELCRVTAGYGGVYATHLRNEGDRLIESIQEAIDIVQKTGVSLQIAHFKIAYPRNWHKVDDALLKLEEAKKQGIEIFCDRYPYIAGSTGLSLYFPLWARQGTTEEFIARLKDSTLESKLRTHILEQEEKLGSWDKVVISAVATEKNRIFEGKSVLQGAKDTGKDPFEFMRDLLIQENNMVGMVTFIMKEENLKKVLAHPLIGVGCDGSAIAPYGVLGRGKPHPRSYGTFPRVLGKYVREEEILPLTTMMKKMTSIPARKFGFKDRGVLARDYFADIVIFDEKRVIDKASWVEPHQYPEGIEYVLVNGETVVERGEHTGKLPGKILRKQEKV